MAWVPALILLAVLAAAVVFDSALRRIPNKLIVAGLVMALGWHVLGPEGSWSFDATRPGAAGATGWLLGSLGLLLAFFPFFALRLMGAGDVKLMAFVGSLFGARLDAWIQLPAVMLLVLTAGGLLALVRMLLSRNGGAVIANIRLILSSYAARAAGQPGPVFDARTDSADRMPYALAIAAGTLFYAGGKWTGWLQVL